MGTIISWRMAVKIFIYYVTLPSLAVTDLAQIRLKYALVQNIFLPKPSIRTTPLQLKTQAWRSGASVRNEPCAFNRSHRYRLIII